VIKYDTYAIKVYFGNIDKWAYFSDQADNVYIYNSYEDANIVAKRLRYALVVEYNK
jgi:hypothetical protein